MTLEEINRFYLGKNINSSCPTCGSSKWIIVDGPDKETEWAFSSARNDGGAVLPMPAIPVVILLCDNCFTTRTHALLAIKNWLIEHPLQRS